jgi:hypothetical protein
MRDGTDPSIRDHLIEINSDEIIELTPDFLATGKLSPTKGTAHEHKLSKGSIGERYPDKGFGGFSSV